MMDARDDSDSPLGDSRCGELDEDDGSDRVWRGIRSEASEASSREPRLSSWLESTILRSETLGEATARRLAETLSCDELPQDALRERLLETIADEGGCALGTSLGSALRRDLIAVTERDPACERLIEPLLWFKGFHALATYRLAHAMWRGGEKNFALLLQSAASRRYGVDIHPAARISGGLMLDHAHGVVIGMTCVIGYDASIMQGATLGGSGKERGDRHPKLGNCVLIGAGAKVLGNLSIGDCSRVAAGAVVLSDVPRNATVAGVPARVVGDAGCPKPSEAMDHGFSA